MPEHLLYIDGAWRDGGASPAAAVSPATGETFASVATGTPADVTMPSRPPGPPGRTGPPPRRSTGPPGSRRSSTGIRERRDELARVLTQDQGKPLAAEAYDEVDELAEYFRMAAEDAKRHEGGLPASTSAGRRILATRVPLGVIAVISPWNWPYTMGAELFGPAMAAGNTVVWVPAPTTSACCAVLADVLAGAGLPPGVFNFVPGPGAGRRRRPRRAPGDRRRRLRRLGRDRRPGRRPGGRQGAAARTRRQRPDGGAGGRRP